MGDMKKRAVALYKPPFKYEHGYIFDSEHNMVADSHETSIARLRGWGRISYLGDPEKLQDQVGEMIAEALTQYWQQLPDQEALHPIDMVLHCPKCGLQHVDEPDGRTRKVDDATGEELPWDNPPHRSHLCHGCAHIWRPADVPTNGVKAIRTKGKADSAASVAEQPEREATRPYGYIVEWWDGKRTFEETLPRKFGGSAVSAREVYDHPAAPVAVPPLTDEQIVNTLAEHGIGELWHAGLTPFPLDGEDAPLFIAAYRALLSRTVPAQHKEIP